MGINFKLVEKKRGLGCLHEHKIEVQIEGIWLEELLIDEYVYRSDLHPFGTPYGDYHAYYDEADDKVYLIHQFDTSD
jgi:hypothetical protein